MPEFFKLKSNMQNPFRKGRGIGSGKGKTAGKGHKGQKARSGKYNIKMFSHGSQTPWYRSVPKRGFVNVCKKEKLTLKLSEINALLKNNVIDKNNVSIEAFKKIGLNYKVIKVIDDKSEIVTKINFVNVLVSKGLKKKLDSYE